MLLFSATVLAMVGCKQKTSLQLFSSSFASAKAIKSKYVMHIKGRPDTEVEFLFSKPYRFLVTSKDFSVASNEEQGHYEVDHVHKVYDLLPWDGRGYPGTGKAVETDYLDAGPAAGMDISKLDAGSPWKVIDSKNGNQTWEKKIEGMEGPQIFRLTLTSQGKPVHFSAPGDLEFDIVNFEYLGEQPIEKFKFAPPDGYVSIRVPYDSFLINYGMKFDTSHLKSNPDVSHLKLEGYTLFAIVDPSEPSSAGAVAWASKSHSEYKTISITKGTAAHGFYDPDGNAIAQITGITPTFVMVDKTGTVVALWAGWDSANPSGFEKDVLASIRPK